MVIRCNDINYMATAKFTNRKTKKLKEIIERQIIKIKFDILFLC